MDTLLPTIEVRLSNRGLSFFGLDGFLESVEVHRAVDRMLQSVHRPKGRAKRSSASLRFNNLDGQISSVFALGERVEIWIGYETERYLRGVFLVRRPSFDFAGGGMLTITLECEDESLPMVGGFQARKQQERPTTETLETLVDRIAKANNLDSEVDPSLANTPLSGISRSNQESDWLFLDRVVHQTGAGWLFVEPVSASEGKSKIVVKPFSGNPLWRLKQASDVQATGLSLTSLGYRVEADYWLTSLSVTMDVDATKDMTAQDVNDEGVPVIAETQEGAQALWTVGGRTAGDVTTNPFSGTRTRGPFAGNPHGVFLPAGVTQMRDFASSVALWNKFRISLSAKLAPAIPWLYPLHIVKLLGAGPFSGKVVLTGVADSWGSDGYTQTLEMKSASMLDPLQTGRKTLVPAVADTQDGVTLLWSTETAIEDAAVLEGAGEGVVEMPEEAGPVGEEIE